ncbi:Light-sensor Protein kinase [Acorus gramineus]|uniref:Light-sensor Protein kinase n=1 Tax=Acorus gramineus TaxID=55184 RepID=A0AAV9ADY3_ACOGR|nr:Light-sensor Protein kinase [Acorus gramineus]
MNPHQPKPALSPPSQAPPPPPQPNHHRHQKFLGTDVCALFIPTSSASGLPRNALSASTDPNPLCLTSSSNGHALHVTLHRIDIGVLLDFEPDLITHGGNILEDHVPGIKPPPPQPLQELPVEDRLLSGTRGEEGLGRGGFLLSKKKKKKFNFLKVG